MSREHKQIPKADILAIDDTPENLALLSQMLTEKGYKVRSVTKGSTALRGAKAAPPDLILLDVKMPEMNGYEVCQHLKADDRTRNIPIIFISALGDVFDKVKAFQAGGVDYITKPFQVEEVLARLNTHLTIRHLQIKLQAQNSQLQQEIAQKTAAEDKFAKAFRACPNPIAIATYREGQLLEVNKSLLQMSGYTKAEIIDRNILHLYSPQDSEKYHQALQKASLQGFVHNQELNFLTKLGQIKTVLLSLELIEWGGTKSTLQIMNDITERKRLENEFISLVSHELRTPMTSTIGALDLLNSGQLGILSDRGKQILKVAIRNTERLTRLVNDILDLERIESGQIAIEPVQCDLQPLLIQAIETMQAMAEKAEVNLLLEPCSVSIRVDPDRLLQTLTNLLSNGIKFTKPGGVVQLTASLEGDRCKIIVQDTGRGIPTDKLDSIFERFQQVDASDSRSKGGTGLGLAICRHIIERHNGKIWVESVLGKGSIFYVDLPRTHELTE
ncbi:Multi-sensor signal transduction histidine kinase [Hyella patelloides LEGE 07179]|uniref:histidine kinase n=1 Tax=Hyella patelloides LEGE 07179 TaxID=945734 RepID=A0A563VM99_9CYAN|nr:ATP-binding protein [Hyella patelloides]VEP12559.1 Multi-sensor signal transduction histidine kinase [Hyella patelloides LEGE 07179]